MMSKRTPLYVYVIIIAVILLLIWGQTRDGKLLPAVEKQFTHIIPETDIAPQDNAFIAMAGFNVDTPEQMIPEGFRAIETTVQEVKKTPYEFNLSFKLPENNKILTLYQFPCDTQQNNLDCLSSIKQQSLQINQLLEEQKAFINNYLALQKYSAFAHTLPSNINSSVPYQYIKNISQLLTAKAILDIQNGQADQGMQFLLDDITFYRHMLASKQKNLEDTMAFTNILSNHYYVLDRLLHTGINLKPYAKKLEPLLTPLSLQERSLVEPFSNERNNQMFIAASLAHNALYTGDTILGGCYNGSCSFDRYFSRLFYKFNDTLNAIFMDWQPTITFAEADYPFDEQYIDRLKTLKTIETARHQMTTYRLYERYGLFLFKNYGGESQKNKLYFSQGYSSSFIKLYALNQNIEQLNTILRTIYSHP